MLVRIQLQALESHLIRKNEATLIQIDILVMSFVLLYSGFIITSMFRLITDYHRIALCFLCLTFLHFCLLIFRQFFLIQALRG